MTPEQIAKANTESAHQTAFMAWCQQHPDPRLNFAFHIPNGGLRNKAEAARLVAQGVRKGVPDVFLPIPVKFLAKPCGRNYLAEYVYHGLWLEFKAPGDEGKAKGRTSPEQEKWREYLLSQNYSHFIVYTYLQAIEVTLNYISQA